MYDPDTGRHRLVKGSGEILEEIVSYSRHKDINRDDNLQQIFGYLRSIFDRIYEIGHTNSNDHLNF